MLKLHNAMWPGLVGKGEPATEAAISMERMLELSAGAKVDGCLLYTSELPTKA